MNLTKIFDIVQVDVGVRKKETNIILHKYRNGFGEEGFPSQYKPRQVTLKHPTSKPTTAPPVLPAKRNQEDNIPPVLPAKRHHTEFIQYTDVLRGTDLIHLQNEGCRVSHVSSTNDKYIYTRYNELMLANDRKIST